MSAIGTMLAEAKSAGDILRGTNGLTDTARSHYNVDHMHFSAR